jgi:hypothetical protein
MVKIAQVTLAPSVQVPPPDDELKIAVSPATGNPAPPAPPDEADHLAVEELSHVPVPPTQ